jgi:D-alanine-D-alanine ligase
MKVLVLSGGDSPEREVSLRSGRAITDALRASGFDVNEYDPINGFDELVILAKNVEMVFPILHGKNGEDGVIQEILEKNAINFLGTRSKESRICFDKEETHKILESEGILMPKYKIVTKDEFEHSIFDKPFVLKPKDGGSSLDTLIARVINNDSKARTLELLDKYDSMIAEELIEGPEITVAVLGKKALPVIAIIPPVDGEFDYNNKYNGASKELCPAPENIVSQALQNEAENLAMKIHNILNARHISRTDMMVNDAGNLYVLELNTMPGMTNQSLFPIAANAVGLSMDKLVLELINLVKGEYRNA